MKLGGKLNKNLSNCCWRSVFWDSEQLDLVGLNTTLALLTISQFKFLVSNYNDPSCF
jgi:hypothetical protein